MPESRNFRRGLPLNIPRDIFARFTDPTRAQEQLKRCYSDQAAYQAGDGWLIGLSTAVTNASEQGRLRQERANSRAEIKQQIRRTQSADSDPNKVLGLGLTLALGTIEAASGIIQTESGPRRATTFTISSALKARQVLTRAS